jgi:hypothetical protein
MDVIAHLILTCQLMLMSSQLLVSGVSGQWTAGREEHHARRGIHDNFYSLMDITDRNRQDNGMYVLLKLAIYFF